MVLEGLGEVVDAAVVDPEEVAGDGGAGGGAVDDLLAPLDGGLEGSGVADVAGDDLDGAGEGVGGELVGPADEGLDGVAAEHELADEDAPDAAGGADDEDGGGLGGGDGELAEEEGGVAVAVGEGRAGDLSEAGELAPDLVEHLPRPPAQAHRVHYRHLLLLLLRLSWSPARLRLRLRLLHRSLLRVAAAIAAAAAAGSGSSG